MKKIILFIIASTFLLQFAYPQDSLQARIVLIGDAGQLTNGRHPVVAGVKHSILLDDKTTILFVGDNLYKVGLPDNSIPNFDIAKAPLDSQIHIADNTPAKVYFIPGNHDWANGGTNGYESILREQDYVNYLSNKNVGFYPKDGCSGPVQVDITKDIVLLIMDSQWWIHPYDKPGVESDCPCKTKNEALTLLEDLLTKNSKKLVLFATHHTFRSFGIHGGYFTIKQHIFPFTDGLPNLYIPLPVIGSLYPLTRAIFGTTEDMKHPMYASMIHDIEAVIRGHQNVIYVAGHEHTLQLIQDSGYNFIVSGSGSKSSRVSKTRKTLFASPLNGFVTLEVSKNKNVITNFYTVKGDSVTKAFTKNIMDFSKIPKAKEDTPRNVEFAFKDSVIISASNRYSKTNPLKNLIMGSNYRSVWGTPIHLKVFNIRTEKGGLKVVSLGGGKQTRSLKLADKDGKVYSLRSVDKDPEKALPENLRGTMAQSIVQDLISASFPYAPPVVEDLSHAVNVPSSTSEFFFIPDDPALGIYRPLFANTVCMLEDREPTPDEASSKSTAKILNKMYESNKNHVNQPAVLNARILDMFIGDWDRHFDQWKWSTSDTGKGKLYVPLPKDRDQAFFKSNGLLVKLATKEKLPFLQGFRRNFPDINGLNYVARNFDRIFLNGLDKNQWQQIIDSFKYRMTDSVINEAVKELPPEIYLTNGKSIRDKLKSRRNLLSQKGLHYYRFLSRNVDVVGSNEQEYFKVKNNNNDVQVIVYQRKKGQDSSSVIFNRTFKWHDTKEIRLYGLNGDDKFEVDQDVHSKIKLRIIGGRGNDTFDLKGNLPNRVYDQSYEKNAIINSRRTHIEFSKDPLINEYQNSAFQYNVKHFPQINLGYNVEDKFLVGMGFSSKTYGFRKEPYSTYQKLSTLYAIEHKAFQVKYQGIFNSVVLGKDIILNGELVDPTLTNFFGFGNNNKIKGDTLREFYRVRYKFIQADLLLRQRFIDIVEVSLGPSYYHYWSLYSDNKSRILANPSIIGTDSSDIYSKKAYLGGKLKVDINFIDNEFIPTRGIIWNTEFSSLAGLNSNSKTITKLTSDMSVYATVSDLSKITAVFRFGGGHIFSNNYEYFQALTLGANNYARGYRKDRFRGSSLAYGSAEMRLKLFKSNSYVIPGDVGAIGFYELGRVWLKNEISHRWHPSYGGGLYFTPFNFAVVSVVMAFSPEDQLFNFSLGTKFNISF